MYDVFQLMKTSTFLLLLLYANASTVTTSTSLPLKSSDTVPPKTSLEKNAINTRNADNNNNNNDIFQLCPRMLPHVFERAVPYNNINGGIFKEYVPSIADETVAAAFEAYNSLGTSKIELIACIAGCCTTNNNSCNIAILYKHKCYHMHCFNNEGCLPKEQQNSNEPLEMVLVRPVIESAGDENRNWLDLMRANGREFEDDLNKQTRAKHLWRKSKKVHSYESNTQLSPFYDDIDLAVTGKRAKSFTASADTTDELSFARSGTTEGRNKMPQICDLELSELSGSRCPPREVCRRSSKGNIQAVCKCERSYVRNEMGRCVLKSDLESLIMDSVASEMVSAAVNDNNIVEKDGEEGDNEMTTTLLPNNNNIPEKSEHIVVSVTSKQVRLPEQAVTLIAQTLPEGNYKYLWTLITQPKGPINGTITDQSESRVRLSKLSVGLYTFKVSVSGADGAYGEAEANVTVLDRERQNRSPQAIITPREQTIRQPTTNAILDGSTSSDDDKIISWHWEVVQAPLGYQPQLPEVNTLQLMDLNFPGNYTFKLTVTDSDNVNNFTTANITVLKSTDYPPVANAGDAVILYLPNKNVTLNGTASSDDHEILAWEWTKDASDEAKAVDMQKTRTPYLQLSNLEEGMYTFVLKVTDGSNQSSTAKVHVFVKPPSNSPPKAEAGNNVTITLPQNWALLNGSMSTDDIKIVRYAWKQKNGPKTALILMSNTSIANATSLTLGLYEFQLSVTDENNNSAIACTWVKVVQETNAPPVAHAGGDLSVTLPMSALYLNGSKSTDDLAVAKYQWTRDESSLAAGLVVGDTDKEPVMILTNLVHGRYVFKLTVSDDQGLTNTDTVTIIVHIDPLLMNLVELTLPLGASDLTKAELDTILQKIGLLLGDMIVHMRELKYDSKSQAIILVFYAKELDDHGNMATVDGLYVEQTLKNKLLRDAKILGTVFADVRTTICQNKCSEHGVCNSITRTCICEAFWMPSAAFFWGLEEANCDWSILYVFVGVLMFSMLLSGIFWGLTLTCQKKKLIPTKKQRSRPKVQKYSLIGTHDEEAPHFGRTSSLTDSETDSDVLFETRTKPNGILRTNGTTKRHNHVTGGKYANTKLSRKIKA